MEKENKIIVFQNKNIRRTWHNDEWYFSIVDVVGALTEQSDPQRARKYWNKLAQRLKGEGNEVVTICHQLKIQAEDGKMRLTDCSNTKGIFRIIQSIPSKKAEPFKLWLAKVGYERVQEIEDPELAQERMKKIYEQKGYSKHWIDVRLKGIAIRQELTDEWKERGVNNKKDFSILTADISKATFDMTPSEYKEHKGLKRENLRDHMDSLELVFSMLGEASTTELEKVKNPKKFEEHREISKEGGTIAKNARLELESKTNQKVSTTENYLEEPECKKKRRLLNVKKKLIKK